MSAAAVIAIRTKQIIVFFKQRQALSEDTAVSESRVPYSDRWYYRRLVDYGAVKQVGDKCYLDENMTKQYFIDRRKRAFMFLVILFVGAVLCFIISSLSP